MSSKLFNLLKREFQPNNNIPNPTVSNIRIPVSVVPVKILDISANIVNPPININQTITPPDVSMLCKCDQIVIYSIPTSIKKGTDLTLKAVYPRSNPASLTTQKKQDQVLSILGPTGIVTQKRFVDIIPPPVPPPQNQQPGYVLYRSTNEPASRIPTNCSGLSTKKWDTS
jgi:hypothetical protein